MKLRLHRILLLTSDPVALARFYSDAFGLSFEVEEEGFTLLRSGPIGLAFHRAAKPRPSAHKLCFFAPDVAKARAALVDRGVEMGRLHGSAETLCFCDGRDPDGNVFQISNRR